MRTCVCGTAVRDYEVFCPNCRKIIPSKGRVGQMPLFMRVFIGLTAIGLASGYSWLIFSSFQQYVADRASQMTEVEQSAVKNLKHLVFAQHCFYATSGRFARSMGELQDFLTPDLLSGRSGEYVFQMLGTEVNFKVQAYPEEPHEAHGRSFWANEDGRIMEGNNGLGPDKPE